MEFKVGDVVSFGGLEGEVIYSQPLDVVYQVQVKFPHMKVFFTIDGKIDPIHTEPVLKFVERKDQKPKLQAWLVQSIASGSTWYLEYRDSNIIFDMKSSERKRAPWLDDPDEK